MKKINLAISFLALGVAACNQTQKGTATDSTTIVQSQDTLEKHCYFATSGQDSATLSLNNLSGKITGALTLNFAEKEDANGTLKGEFIGDTLFVDYTYTAKGTTGRNPLVFLKQGEQLVQGHGEIETYLGKTYFKDHTALKFQDGFTFNPGDCR